MGHKVNPKIFRIGVINTWGSKWFSNKNYIAQLKQDLAIRKFLLKKLMSAGIAKVDIERGPAKLVINMHVVKPGLIIGKSGAGIEDLKQEIIKKIINKKDTSVPEKINITINVLEVDNPNTNAKIIMDGMIYELEKRMPYRRVMKQAIQKADRAGAKGVKVSLGGRLNGADIARKETLSKGRLPLHTLRADIDYTRGAAATTFGKIGVKVWVYKGEVFNKKTKKDDKAGTVVQSNKQTKQ